jgi:hypothetical protein
MWKATWLLRREVVLLLFSFLSLTAPLSWPAYSTCLLVITMTISCLAHVTFRRYQLIASKDGSRTIVNYLLMLLSVFVQAGELHFNTILLLRLLLPERSLLWYQSHPVVFCILLSPK